MDLFDNTPDRPQAAEKASGPDKWSYSRRSMLDQCPRAYYYRYYGSKKNTAEQEPHTKELRRLKQLSNRHLLAGDILHLVIGKHLEDLREGEGWPLERMKSWAQDLFEESIAVSRSHERGDPIPDDYHGPSLLLEYYYSVDDADSLCREARERLMMALEHFTSTEEIRRLQMGARHEEALIEGTVRQDVSGVTITGTVDLAYPDFEEDEGRVNVVDWKLGGKRISGESLQLLAYGRAGAERFDCEVEGCLLHQVRLADGEVDSWEMTRRKALQARCRILQDMDRMQMLDDHGRRAERGAFPPCQNPKVCALCEFQELCPGSPVSNGETR